MTRPIHCYHCGETRRTWSLWQQIVNLGKPVVCCLLGSVSRNPDPVERGV